MELNMTAWYEEAKNLITISHGKRQAELAYQSICSTIDRQEYARYHYRNAKILFDAYVGKLHSPIAFMKSSIEGSEELNRCILEIGANVTACVQSLHAIADTFAYATYYALGYNLKPSPLSERKISQNSVKCKLLKIPEHQSLVQELDLLVSGDDFTYLCALANHSKHRSLIRPEPWVDLTGKKLDPYSLEFQEFIYDKKPYPRRAILPFLQSEFDRQSLRVFEAGNVLNLVLKSEPA
jgi:hypothetical protein